MSFRDEINEVIKTPEEIENKRKQESISVGLKLAQEDYEKIKEEFKTAAQNGKYKTENGRKTITIEFDSINLCLLIDTGCARYDKIINRGIICSVKDVDKFTAYKNELIRLAQADDIRIVIKGVFTDDDGTVVCFDIPGTSNALSHRTTVHITRRLAIVIRCSLEV